jgi:hypothetical protein
MKYLNKLLLLCLIVSLAACYEEKNFFDENTTATDKTVPFIYVYALDSATFTPGTKARVLLEFFCKEPLKEIRLHQSIGTVISGTRTLVTTESYKPAFSQIRQMDTLVLTYTVPSGNPVGTTIFLHGEAVSTKDIAKGTWLTPTSSRSFKTK